MEVRFFPGGQIMDIVKIPNKILTKKLKEVSMADIKSGSLKELFLEMKKDMVAHNGVGLAGNQIGKDLAVFVIDENIAKEAGMSDVYINPEITEYSKDTDDMEEGCLSIKEYYVPIKHSKKIKIKFFY